MDIVIALKRVPERKVESEKASLAGFIINISITAFYLEGPQWG